MSKTCFQTIAKVLFTALVVLIAGQADAQRVRLKQLERYLGNSTPIGPGREWYIGVTDTFGDQRYKRLDTLMAYIADSMDTDTDEQYVDSFFIRDDTLYVSLIRDGQVNKLVDLKPYLALGDDIQYIDTFYFDMDTLYISLVRDGVNLQKVYLGDLVAIADQDKQRHDTAFIENDILYLSLQRDSIPAHQIDLSPYLDDTDDQVFLHSGTTDYTNELSGSGGTNFTLIGGTGITIAHDGGGNVTISSSVAEYWLMNGLDDAFSASMIMNGNTATFDGTNGITAKLSFDGSQTMVVDGSLLQHYVAATTGTPALIGDAGSAETVTYVGAGITATSISGNTITFTSTEVDGSVTNEGSLSVGAGTASTSLIQSNTSGSPTITLQEAGIVDISESGNTITISATEVDGSTSNEIQAFTHTGSGQILSTLSLGGGSLNIVPGTGISMVRSGTASDGIITISNSISIDHDWYEVGTTTPPDAITDAMFHTGLTGIGMNPTYLLDVAADSRIYGHQIGRGGGSKSTNFRAGLDALQNNTTGEYNTAVGSNALKSNTTSTENTAVGYNALALLTTGTWNTAFGAYSMEKCVTCFDNTSIGFYALGQITNAQQNTAVGHAAGYGNKSGGGNTALGDLALFTDSLPTRNVAIGQYAMELGDKHTGNIGIGYSAISMVAGGTNNTYNIGLGYQSMFTSSSYSNADFNIGIGYNSLNGFVGGDYNLAIGASIGQNLSGSNNYLFGRSNTVTGNVDDNLILGYNQTATTAGNIIITNGAGTLGFKMLSSGFVGIGETTPTQKLHVPGNVRVTGAYYDSNNSAGTSGQILSSTVTGTDWIDAGSTTTNLTFSGSGPVTLNSSTGTDVTITAGTNISFSSISSGNITINAASGGGAGLSRTAGDNGYRVSASDGTYVGIEAGAGIDVSASGGSSYDMFIAVTGNLATLNSYSTNGLMTYSSGSILGRTITAGNGISVSNGDGVSGNPTISSTSGFNGVGAGTSTSSTITTNTTGGNAITIQVAGTLSIAESTSANGGTITLTGTGGAGTVTSVGLTGTTGIGVSGSPITSSGTFTLSLNNDLQAVEGLSGTGLAVRTGSAAWTNRTITSSGVGLFITNGNGVSGDPTLALNAHLQSISGIGTTGIAYSSSVGSWSAVAFGSLATGLTTNAVMYVDGSGTPDSDADMTYSSSTNTLVVDGNIHTDNLYILGLPTYASEAAASGLATGRVYKTSTGELRIKL